MTLTLPATLGQAGQWLVPYVTRAGGTKCYVLDLEVSRDAERGGVEGLLCENGGGTEGPGEKGLWGTDSI